jgi:predicted acylesterase/phospholipase RssA
MPGRTLSDYLRAEGRPYDVRPASTAADLRLTLGENPVLAELGWLKLTRLAELLVDQGWGQAWQLPAGVVIDTSLLQVDVLILLRMDSSIQTRWTRPLAGGEDADNPEGARWASTHFVGGALLGLGALQASGDGAGRLRSATTSRVTLYLIPPGLLFQVAGRRSEALKTHLLAAAAAAFSPGLKHVVARQRSRLAARMQQVSADELPAVGPEEEVGGARWRCLLDFGQRSDALYLVGQLGEVRITRRWRPPGEPDETSAPWGADDLAEPRGQGEQDAARGLRRRLRRRLYGGGWLPVREAPFGFLMRYGDVFGLSVLEETPLIQARVLVAPGTRLYRIERRALEALLREREIDQLSAGLDGMMDLSRRLPILVACMMRKQLLSRERAGNLAMALAGAQILQWRVGAPAPPPLGDAQGLGLVMEGELLGYSSFYSASDPDTRLLGPAFQRLKVHPRGACLGMAGMRRGFEAVEALQPRTPVWLAFVSRQRLINTLGDDVGRELDSLLRSLQRTRALADADPDVGDPEVGDTGIGAVGAASPAAGAGRAVPLPPELENLLDGMPEGAHPAPQRVVFLPLGSLPGWSPGPLALVEALAREVFARFGERALVVSAEVWRGGEPRVFHGNPLRLELDCRELVGPGGVDAEGLDAALDTLAHRARGRFHYLFVLAEDHTPLGRALVRRADRVVYLSADPDSPPPPPLAEGVPFVYGALRQLSGGLLASRRGQRYPPATARLGVEGGELNSACLSRWARAVTDRQVGVALGGGGAWGMAHVAVLRAIHNAGVPIDLVSGASVGCSVGAFYAARQLEGLDLFLDRRLALQAASLGGLVTSTVFAATIEHLLGDIALEELCIPFTPVATDLSTASECPLLTGAVAFATRESGSFAPFYPGTPTREGAFVDGGISRNLPVGTLELEGARLIVASNIVPPPAFEPPRLPRFGGTAGRVLADINLARRIRDGLKSGLTLFYSAGNSTAEDAAVTFESQFTGVFPLDLIQGARLIDDVQSTPAFWQTVGGLVHRWTTLSAPRTRGDVE